MKLTTLILPLALLVGATIGCSPSEKSDTNQTSGSAAGSGSSGKALKVGVVFDSGGRGDKSFNDSAWAGVDKAKAELGVEEISVETKADKDYEVNQSAMAEKGCDLVICVGINQLAALKRVAPKFPDTKFALIDAVLDEPNVRSLTFREEEGSFVVGYLAGLMSKSGKIGFIGGMELPLIKKFQVGFEAGAKTANGATVMLPAKYTGDWNNADLAKEAAKVLYSQGADIVFSAAGRAGLGAIAAAKEAGKFAIGVDSDQDYIAPGTVLTSMIKHVDVAVFNTIKDLKEGKFSSGSVVYDLKVGGVGASPFSHTKDLVGEDNIQKLDAISKKIVSGEIQVPSDEAQLTTYLSSLPKG